MLIPFLMMACHPEPAAPDSAAASTAPRAGTTLFGTSGVDQESRIVEVDDAGTMSWEWDVASLFGDDWATMSDHPTVADTQAVAGGTILFSLYGYGIFEIDRAGTVVWSHLDPQASHDVDRLPNGNTLYTRGWAAAGDDAAVEVDSDGNELWTWNGVAAYGTDARFADIVDEGGGWMHTTAAQRFANGETGLNLRNFNALVVVNEVGEVTNETTFESPSDTTFARTSGPLLGDRPHGAEWAPDGSVTVALREPDRAVTLRGDVVEWTWQKVGVSGITDVDRLPDGPTLLASHDHLLALDAQDGVVWQWESDLGTGAEGTPGEGKDIHAFHSISPRDADGAPLDHD